MSKTITISDSEENLRTGGFGDIEKMYPEAYKLARQFHQIYEENAPFFGYITNEKTREFDPYSSNGRLMAYVCMKMVKEWRDEVEKKIFDLYRGQRKIGEDMSEFQPRVDDMDFGWNDAIDKVLQVLDN